MILMLRNQPIYKYMEIFYEALLSVVKELYNATLNLAFIYLKNIDSCAKSCLASIYTLFSLQCHIDITNQSN